MKPLKIKNYFLPFLFVGTFIFFGCRPTVREAVKVASEIPMGASRDEVRTIFLKAYSKKFAGSRILSESALPLRSNLIEGDKILIKNLKEMHCYVRIFPSDLLGKLSDMDFEDGVTFVAETSDSNGSLTIYDDNHTNYIGFIAESQYARDR